MKRFRIVHTTEYRFDNPISACRLALRMRPREASGQSCTFFQAVTRPPSFEQHDTIDRFGNPVTHLQIQTHLQRLAISAISTVVRQAPPEAETTDYRPQPSANRAIAGYPDTNRFREPTPLTPATPDIVSYARASLVPEKPLPTAVDLCRRIHTDMAFKPGTTHVGTRADQVLTQGRGVCQDFAHLAVACLRSMGMAARYVSGYVHTAAVRGTAHRIASDASHAWFEVFDPQCGWVGFDPTNHRKVDDNSIIVAWGRDYNDACPLQGTFEGGGAHSLHVSVDVEQMF